MTKEYVLDQLKKACNQRKQDCEDEIKEFSMNEHIKYAMNHKAGAFQEVLDLIEILEG